MMDDYPGNYYYDWEVAQNLNMPVQAVWQMVRRGELSATHIDGKVVFPKQHVDGIVARRDGLLESVLDNESSVVEEKYYRLDQFADAIRRDLNEFTDKSIEIHGQLWIAESEAEKIIANSARRLHWRDETIRERLPQLKSKEDAKKRSAEALIRYLQEDLDKEREAKIRKSEDASYFEKLLDKAQGKFDEEKQKNRRLRQDLEQQDERHQQSMENARRVEKKLKARLENSGRDNGEDNFLAEFEREKACREDTEQHLHKIKEEYEELRAEIADLNKQIENLATDARLLEQVRLLLEKGD